jgi:hypothetical protein
MTEDEAKTKTCHRSIIPVASADGSAPWFSTHNCIGSACMAWRPTDNETFPSPPDKPSPPSKPAGYCGLAGKP